MKRGIAFVFGTVLLSAVVVSCNRSTGPATQESRDQTPLRNPVRTAGQQSYADIVDRVAPAVVTIYAERRVRAPRQFPFFNDPFFRRFFGPPPDQGGGRGQVQRGLGSGVTVSEDGYIITNHHVIDGAEDIRVEYVGGKTHRAKLIGSDPPSDLAVLKINASKLPLLPLGDSDGVRVGDVVLAIGNPLGVGQTVTAGIISAKGRSTGLSDGSFEDFLQTDAPVNRGNSGGALVNTAGELVGINSQILSPSGGNIGIAFAIPSNMARDVRDQLIKSGEVKRGQLGVTIQPLTEDLAQGFGLKDTDGVLVGDVIGGSPAQRAGIRPGDVIREIDGEKVSTPNRLRNKISSLQPGSEVTVTLIRDKEEQKVKVRLGEYQGPSSREPNGGGDEGDEPGDRQSRLGLSLQPLTPEIARQLGLRGVSSGLLVRDVDPSGPASEAGLAPGDVIVEANRQQVRSLEDFQRVAGRSATILLRINRQGQSAYVTVRPG
jgi:Do/DeqQ family serine protease